MDSSHRLSIQGTALGHCSLPSLWAPHPEPGALKHSPPPALHVHEAPVPLTAHPCRAPSHFTNEETEAPELNGERTVHSEAPRARSFFHHLLLVGLEEVSELGALGNLREREGGGQGGGWTLLSRDSYSGGGTARSNSVDPWEMEGQACLSSRVDGEVTEQAWLSLPGQHRWPHRCHCSCCCYYYY